MEIITELVKSYVLIVVKSLVLTLLALYVTEHTEALALRSLLGRGGSYCGDGAVCSGVYVTELIRRFGSSGIPAEGDTVGIIMVLAYNALMILSVVIGSVFLLVNLKRFYRSLKKGEYTLTFDQWMNALLINPGVWAFVAWMALVFISSLVA